MPVLIYEIEKYYSLNLDDWNSVQDFYNEEKYILIMNPNYTIYNAKMNETEGTDGILCLSPNETILFKDETDLNNFFELLNKNLFKNLGDIMFMRKYYDKAINFYKKSIINDTSDIKKAEIYSLLSECYIKYKYYSKGIEYIDKCFKLLDNLIRENKNNIDKLFIMKIFLRKIGCLIGLRNFKNAFEIFNKVKQDKEI